MPPYLTQNSDPALAANITRAANKQTYYIIRFLADKGRIDNAYRAYAYFRWVDDWLDREEHPRAEQLAFLQRQQALITKVENGEDPPDDLTAEERLVVDLLHSEPDTRNGLHTYVHDLMSVMTFDAERCGRLVTKNELNDYTGWLASAVTEAMHYFIGHDRYAPSSGKRYQAAIGAHIAHMLRDTLEDVVVGYYNIPREVVENGGITPVDVDSQVYRDWVHERVKTARACFKAGRDYLAEVESLRCRMAAYAYIHRFEELLDSIERDNYLLRADYAERNGHFMETIGWALWMTFKTRKSSNKIR